MRFNALLGPGIENRQTNTGNHVSDGLISALISSSGRTLVSAYNAITQVFLNILKFTINVLVLLVLVKTF